MIKEIFEKAILSNKLIGVRTFQEDWEEVIIGYVKKIDEIELILAEVDKQGVIIGNILINVEDIINVDYDDRYQRKLEFFNKLELLNFENKQLTILKNGQLLVNYFQELIEGKYVVQFYFDDNHYETGVLQKYDEKYFFCKNIGNNGEYEGFSIFAIENLTGIKYNGIEQYKLKLLFDENNDKGENVPN